MAPCNWPCWSGATNRVISACTAAPATPHSAITGMPSQNSGPVGARAENQKADGAAAKPQQQRPALAETLHTIGPIACALHGHRADADHRQRQADRRRIPAVAIGRIEHEG